MSIHRTLLGLIVAFGPTVFAQDGQPTQQLVHLETNGMVTLTGQRTKPVYETVMKTYTEKVPYTETRRIEENGVFKDIAVTVYKDVTKAVPVTVCKMVCVAECSPVDLKSAKAFEVDGRRIPIGDLTRRLTEGTIVVVSATEDMIPEYYASIYKPGTVILALPKTGMMMPPGSAMPMPAPQFAPPAPPVEAPRPPAAKIDAPLAVQLVAFQPPVAPTPAPAAPAPAIATPAGERAPGPWDLLPKTSAPRIVFASRSGADQLKIRQFAEMPTFTEVTVIYGDESTANYVLKKAPQVTRQSATVTLALKDVRFSSSDSKDIVVDRVKEKLGATEQTVLLSADGKPVDEFWLKNIKPSVLVLRGVSLPPVATGSAYPASPMAYPAPMAAPMPAAPSSPRVNSTPQPAPAPAAPAPPQT